MARDPLTPLTQFWWLSAIIVEAGDSLSLHLEPTRTQAFCPVCGAPSARRHSRYERRALDLPWRGSAVRLLVHARRFFCDEPTCRRRIFCERFDGEVAALARRTTRATATLVAIALRTSGEAGARLAVALGLPTSPDTLLRLLRAQVPDSVEAPRVLGVDDLALRRGQHCATLLIDLETHRPLDLLEDRTAQVLAGWLREHPGVEVLARDRAEAYAEGGRQGAPAARQVADRFHLVQNAGAALGELLRGRTRAIERAEAEAAPLATTARPPSQSQQRRATARARRVARWEEVQRRQVGGQSILGIARELHMGRRTVRRMLAQREPPCNQVIRPRPTGLSSPSLQPYVAFLQERWQAGCTNISQLYREIVGLGYRRSRSLLAQALLTWRGPRPPPGPDGKRRRGRPRIRRFSLRWLCLRPPEHLESEEHAALDQAWSNDADLATGYTLLQRFRHLIAAQDGVALQTWLAAALGSGLPPFVSLARGIEADRAAVDAALSTHWSTGPVEGHVCRVKLLKRRGYGRAKLDLLRARVPRAS